MTISALLFLLLWMVFAIVAASTAFIALSGSSMQQWFRILGIMLEFFYLWAAISILVYWTQRKLKAMRVARYRRMLVHLGFLGIILVATPILVHTGDWRDWLYGSRAAASHALNVFMYAFVVIGYKVLDYYRGLRAREAEYYQSELRRMELENALDQSRMETIRSKINPHFLFNALNSLAALIAASSNREAYDFVERLAILLRNALDHSRDQEVTLAEELEFLDAYLAIEKVRFGSRISIEYEVPEEALTLPVPSFSLQPLVENVIKHAVSSTNDTTTIRVSAFEHDDRIELAVSDNGPGLPSSLSPGVGLSNIEQRLRHLYGEKAALELASLDGGGTCITLSFPKASRSDQQVQREPSTLTGNDAAAIEPLSPPA